MATAERKVLVLKRNRDTVPADSFDRDFFMQWRHTLLQQLAMIEKKLGISRRCKRCGEST